MRRLVATVAMMSVSLAALSAIAQEQKGDEHAKKASIWMKQKLTASQHVLAGLTEADFEAIGKNAASMLVVEFLEKWVRADVPGYRAQLTDFEHANRSLVRAAREKNLDAATVAYVQLTISCVNCHKLVRDVKK